MTLEGTLGIQLKYKKLAPIFLLKSKNVFIKHNYFLFFLLKSKNIFTKHNYFSLLLSQCILKNLQNKGLFTHKAINTHLRNPIKFCKDRIMNLGTPPDSPFFETHHTTFSSFPCIMGNNSK